jgi:hypothetical protein
VCEPLRTGERIQRVSGRCPHCGRGQRGPSAGGPGGRSGLGSLAARGSGDAPSNQYSEPEEAAAHEVDCGRATEQGKAFPRYWDFGSRAAGIACVGGRDRGRAFQARAGHRVAGTQGCNAVAAGVGLRRSTAWLQAVPICRHDGGRSVCGASWARSPDWAAGAISVTNAGGYGVGVRVPDWRLAFLHRKAITARVDAAADRRSVMARLAPPGKPIAAILLAI